MLEWTAKRMNFVHNIHSFIHPLVLDQPYGRWEKRILGENLSVLSCTVQSPGYLSSSSEFAIDQPWDHGLVAFASVASLSPSVR